MVSPARVVASDASLAGISPVECALPDLAAARYCSASASCEVSGRATGVGNALVAVKGITTVICDKGKWIIVGGAE